MNGSKNKNGVQVIGRAAAILRCIERTQDGLSLADLASRLSLARSTVQRIVRALTDEGMLVPAGPHGRVKLGSFFPEIVGEQTLDIGAMVRPILEQLSRDCEETVDLSIAENGSALLIDEVVGQQRLTAFSRAGEAFPLHATANGKALLAAIGPAAAKTELVQPLLSSTQNTIVDICLLADEIREVSAQGYAIDREEHTIGICAVGTWFIDPVGHAFAISIAVPAQRFDPNARMVQALLAARNTIQSIFRWGPSGRTSRTPPGGQTEICSRPTAAAKIPSA